VCAAAVHRRALKALADLFALRCIEQDVIFRNDEYVAPAKVSDCQKDCPFVTAVAWVSEPQLQPKFRTTATA
jgi:hypothetical protein